MNVFIANATKQNLQFVYRLPEHKRPITQTVPYGQQKKLAQDMSALDIEAIRTQWDKYGLIELQELESHRHKFQGFLISFNKPISTDKLKLAAKYREAVLNTTGREFRKSSAVVMADTIARETGIRHDTYQFTVAQVEPDQGFANGDDSHTAETYVISNDPNAPPTQEMISPHRAARDAVPRELPPVVNGNPQIDAINRMQWRLPVPSNSVGIDHAQEGVIAVERAHAINGAAHGSSGRRQTKPDR